MQEQASLPYRSLEYWTPPKKVPLHIRAKSSVASFLGTSSAGAVVSNNQSENSTRTASMSRYGRESGGDANPFSDNLAMKEPAATTAYAIDRPDTLNPRWYEAKHWGWKVYTGIVAALVIVIMVVVVTVVEVQKANRYPNYSKLTYTLQDTYSGTDFFDNFDYFTGYDPASGFIHYVPAETADSAQYNLTYASSSSAVLRVDTTVDANSDPNASTGRFSVRISSKKQYATGLFIFDIIHTPMGCATWPALWLTDPNNWPTNGEIDVMEAVNVVTDVQNQMTLHTSDGCSMSVKRKETGSALKTNCLNSTNSNAGCGVQAGDATFGQTYNNNGGGVVAMELRPAGIRMWQFARDSIPADITAGTPDPSTWNEATADFPSTDCDIGTHFRNQSIIANIDLCGLAETDSSWDDLCPGTCSNYVANNNTAFADSYWEFGAWTVYQAS